MKLFRVIMVNGDSFVVEAMSDEELEEAVNDFGYEWDEVDEIEENEEF